MEREGEVTKFQFTFKKVPREIEIQAEKLRDLERERKTEREENYRKLRERKVESRSHEGEQKVLEGTQEAAIEREVKTRENAEKMKEVETREIEGTKPREVEKSRPTQGLRNRWKGGGKPQPTYREQRDRSMYYERK